jgi:hypothetical protein
VAQGAHQSEKHDEVGRVVAHSDCVWHHQ